MKFQSIDTIEQLEDVLSTPTQAVIDMFSQLKGDLLVFGAAGKMGPTLSRMAQRAFDQISQGQRVIAMVGSLLQPQAS